MKLLDFHRLSAGLIGAYASVHITNHLVGLAGVESHLAFMRAARRVYRSPVVETALLLAVAFQVISGLALVVRGWKERQGGVAWLQAGSGAYLALFFPIHVGAVLLGRAVLHLDTNFYYAAAGFHVPPFQLFFGPYYFLAVLALFTHLGCALHWRVQLRSRRARVISVLLPVSVGFVVSLLIVLSLAGELYPVHVPQEYRSSYGRHP